MSHSSMSQKPQPEKEVSAFTHRLGDSCKIILPHCTNQKIWCVEHQQYHRIEDDECLQIEVRRKSSIFKKTTRSLKNAVLPRRTSKESNKYRDISDSPTMPIEMEQCPGSDPLRHAFVNCQCCIGKAKEQATLIQESTFSRAELESATKLHHEHIIELYTGDLAAAELEHIDSVPAPVSPVQRPPAHSLRDQSEFTTPQSKAFRDSDSFTSPSISRRSTDDSIFSHGGSVDTGLTDFTSRNTSQVYDHVEPFKNSRILNSDGHFNRMLTDANFCPSPPNGPIREGLSNHEYVVPDLDLESPISPMSRSSTYGMFQEPLTACNSGLQAFGQQESWEWATASGSGLASHAQEQNIWNKGAHTGPAEELINAQEIDDNLPDCPSIFEMPDTSYKPTTGNVQGYFPDEHCNPEILKESFSDMLHPESTQYLCQVAGPYPLDPNAASAEAFRTVHLESCASSSKVDVQQPASANLMPSPQIVKRKPIPLQTPRGKSKRRPSYPRRGSAQQQPQQQPYQIHGTHPYERNDNISAEPQLPQPIICDQCPYEPKGSDANKKTNLRRHKKSVHSINGEVCIPCLYCPTTFNRSDNMNAHTKFYHPEHAPLSRSAIMVQQFAAPDTIPLAKECDLVNAIGVAGSTMT